MNKTNVLCRMNRFMMEAFSRQTIAELQQHTLFKLMLPVFNTFLQLNVSKEIEKDCQVIQRAAELYQSGHTPADDDVRELLQQSKTIDQTFLRDVSAFPIAIHIDYADIEKVRQQRIECLLRESHRIMTQWSGTPRITLAITSLYDHHEFNAIVYDILHLYSLETQQLSRSVRMPSLLFIARDALTQTVSITMETVVKRLAAEVTERVYRHAH